MFGLVIVLIVLAVIVGAYLVDRYDRKQGHQIGTGPEFRARLRQARKQSREKAWGRRPFGQPGRSRREDPYDGPSSRGRRTH